MPKSREEQPGDFESLDEEIRLEVRTDSRQSGEVRMDRAIKGVRKVVEEKYSDLFVENPLISDMFQLGGSEMEDLRIVTETASRHFIKYRKDYEDHNQLMMEIIEQVGFGLGEYVPMTRWLTNRFVCQVEEYRRGGGDEGDDLALEYYEFFLKANKMGISKKTVLKCHAFEVNKR